MSTVGRPKLNGLDKVIKVTVNEEVADMLDKAPKSVYPLLNTLVKRGFVSSAKVEITEVINKEVTVYSISEAGRELVLE